MTQTLTIDGKPITYRTNGVLVMVSLVETGHSLNYRASVCYGSTGMEVGVLSRTFGTEQEARAVARRWSERFNAGLTIQQACDEVEATRPAPAEDLDTYQMSLPDVATMDELRARFPRPTVDPAQSLWDAFDARINRAA